MGAGRAACWLLQISVRFAGEGLSVTVFAELGPGVGQCCGHFSVNHSCAAQNCSLPCRYSHPVADVVEDDVTAIPIHQLTIARCLLVESEPAQ